MGTLCHPGRVDWRECSQVGRPCQRRSGDPCDRCRARMSPTPAHPLCSSPAVRPLPDSQLDEQQTVVRDLIPDRFISLSVGDMTEGGAIHPAQDPRVDDNVINELGKRIIAATDGHVLRERGEVGIGGLAIIQVGPDLVVRLGEPAVKVPQDGEPVTSCASGPTSMPAACRLIAASFRGSADWERGSCCLRWAMGASVLTGNNNSGSGCRNSRIAVLFPTGPCQRPLPLMSPRAPGITLRHGHTALLPLLPHTAHYHQPRRLQAAPQFLAVARPHRGLTTLIRVSPCSFI
jgi:hypothetical protein